MVCFYVYNSVQYITQKLRVELLCTNCPRRTGYVVIFTGCAITWGGKLQAEITLNTTESEYIALSTSMREVISFLGLMQEIEDIFGLLVKKPEFKFTIQYDRTILDSCIAVAKSPKYTPRTKHIAFK